MGELTKSENQVAHGLFDVAKKMREHGEEVTPMFHVVTPNETLVIMAIWNSEEEKRLSTKMIKQICKEKRASFVAFVTESWMVMVDGKDKDALKKAKDIKPSEHPDRAEVIMVIVESFRGVWTGYAPILSKTQVGEFKFEESKDPEGRMFGFLPREQWN